MTKNKKLHLGIPLTKEHVDLGIHLVSLLFMPFLISLFFGKNVITTIIYRLDGATEGSTGCIALQKPILIHVR